MDYRFRPLYYDRINDSEVSIQAFRAINQCIPILAQEIKSCGHGEHAANCRMALLECLRAIDAQAQNYHAMGINQDYTVESMHSKAAAL